VPSLVVTASPLAAAAAATEEIRDKLEAAAGVVAERERSVEELERRLAKRMQDVRELQALLERRHALGGVDATQNNNNNNNYISAVAAGGVQQEQEQQQQQESSRYKNHLQTEGGVNSSGVDASLVAEIEAFFLSSQPHPPPSSEMVSAAAPSLTTCTTNPSTTSAVSGFCSTEEGGKPSSNSLLEVEEEIEAMRARIAIADGRILEIAAGDEEIIAAAVDEVEKRGGPVTQGGLMDPVVKESSTPLTKMVESPPPPPPSVQQLLFDMLVAGKQDARRAAGDLEAAQARVKALELEVEAKDAAIAASRLHTERLLAETRREALLQGEMFSQLSSGGGGGGGRALSLFSAAGGDGGGGCLLAAAASPPSKSGMANPVNLPCSPEELGDLLRNSSRRLTSAENEAVGGQVALRAAEREIVRLKTALAEALAGNRSIYTAPPSITISSTAKDSTAPAPVPSAGATRRSRPESSGTQQAVKVDTLPISVTVTTNSAVVSVGAPSVHARRQGTIGKSTTSNNSVKFTGGVSLGSAPLASTQLKQQQQQQHQENGLTMPPSKSALNGIPVVSVGLADLSAGALGRGGPGNSNKNVPCVITSPQPPLLFASIAGTGGGGGGESTGCDVNMATMENEGPGGAGAPSSLGWWKKRGVSVVGRPGGGSSGFTNTASVGIPQTNPSVPPHGSQQQQQQQQIQALRSHLNATLPQRVSLQGDEGSVSSSPGSEVLRISSSLHRLQSPLKTSAKL